MPRFSLDTSVFPAGSAAAAGTHLPLGGSGTQISAGEEHSPGFRGQQCVFFFFLRYTVYNFKPDGRGF